MGVWGSSLLFCLCHLCQGNKCSTVQDLGSASAGVMIWLLGGPSQSRYHLSLWVPSTPIRPDSQPQLHNWLSFYQPRSPTINQWWCTSVCAVRIVSTTRTFFFFFFIQEQAALISVLFPSTESESCVKLDDQLSSVCKGLTRVCSKSQFQNFGVKMISAKQNHAPKLGGFLRGRTQLLFACK